MSDLLRKIARPLLFATLCLSLAFAVAAFSAEKKRPIRFSHATHSADVPDCKTCHAETLKDQGIHRILPDKKICADCHDVKDEKSCTTCHVADVTPAGWVKKERRTNFLHSQHLSSIENCKRCHVNPDNRPAPIGNHEICGACHGSDFDRLLCRRCHRNLSDYNPGRLRTFRHKGHFLKDHGKMASRSVRICSQCHTEGFCNDCHSKKSGIKPSVKYPERVERGFMHRGDYITLHRIEAQTDTSTCLKCHASKDCQSCHDKSKASPKSGRDFFKHPQGWMTKGAKKFHGEQARRNIIACASCHQSGGPGNCVNCHKASGGLNPHPKGWNSSGTSKNDRMCKQCHDK